MTTDDFVRAVLTGEPYRVRGLVAFGTNLLVSRGGVAGVREALGALEFTVHTDLFMNPSAAYADIVLPVTSPWEHESLKVGFEMDQEAMGLVQLRPAAVAARGEARSDTAIVFDLAVRLGLGNEFWGGELEAAWRHQLGPSGLRLDELRAAPDGVRVPLRTEYRKYRNGRGFETPSSRVEIWSETFRSHGYPPLPAFVEPATGPASAPELATRYPLVLTSAKSGLYCHSQHRNLASLRRRSPDPEVEIHPETAASRGIAAGDWVEIASPAGTMRARARLNGSLDPRVVAAAHGWWQACTELGLQGYPVDGEGAANVNALIPAGTADPISGSVPHRSFLCEVRKPGRGA
ncbi:MAG: molybdopterin-dependent oxidoreductase [Alphaproteobacteria bacterium]|nr:molybdopterin-dependent oxidoreductase [Alphaproteobacteria bacterium]